MAFSLAKKCAAPLTRRSARLPEWRQGKGVRYAPFPLSAIMRVYQQSPSELNRARAARVLQTRGGSGNYRLFLFPSSSARDLHSLQTSRTNPATVAAAARMKRTFSIIGDHPFQGAPPASDFAGVGILPQLPQKAENPARERAGQGSCIMAGGRKVLEHLPTAKAKGQVLRCRHHP